MIAPIRILALEPFLGGLHADFLAGLRERSRHAWTALVMPARQWRWRMRGAALHLAHEAAGLAGKGFDLLFAGGYLNLADFRALAPPAIGRLPAVVYLHDSQLARPAEPGQRRDLEYDFINLVTALAATEVWFNSAFHRDAFLGAARALLAEMPDFVPEGLSDGIAAKARVMPPAADLRPFVPGRGRKRKPPLTILWNQRWELEADPEAFFEALYLLDEQKVPFRLAVVGEAMRRWPRAFEEARRRLADRLVRFGYIPDRRDYEDQVRRSDVVVSTARHEFFGLPVVEAVAAGCFPLLPAALSYPEIVPADLHGTFLYRDERELRVKLARVLKGKAPWDHLARLADHVQRYDWGNRIREFDEALERAAHL